MSKWFKVFWASLFSASLLSASEFLIQSQQRSPFLSAAHTRSPADVLQRHAEMRGWPNTVGNLIEDTGPELSNPRIAVKMQSKHDFKVVEAPTKLMFWVFHTISLFWWFWASKYIHKYKHRIRLETLSRFVWSKKPITCLNLLAYAWNTEGYGFIANSRFQTVLVQPYSVNLSGEGVGEREREREIGISYHIILFVYVYTPIYIYIYIYKHRIGTTQGTPTPTPNNCWSLLHVHMRQSIMCSDRSNSISVWVMCRHVNRMLYVNIRDGGGWSEDR